ncbi:MAG: ACT domain-containing protein [Limisphaerales bacterium]
MFLDNRPGTLGRLCEALAEAKINIFAISSSDTVDHIVFRMVVSDPIHAKRILDERGTLVVSTEVLLIDGVNKPGSLAEIANKLGAAKINIEYAYSATHPTAQKGLLILRVSDPKKALKVLNS